MMGRSSILLVCCLMAAPLWAGPIEQAEDAAAEGKLDLAAHILRNAAKTKPEDDNLRARAHTAAKQAAATHRKKASAAIEDGDFKAADAAFRYAIYWQPHVKDHRDRYADLRTLRRSIDEQFRRLDVAVANNDWFGARRMGGPLLDYSRSYPRIQALWEQIREENYKIHMREGQRYDLLMDYKRSALHFEQARDLFPDRPAAARGLSHATRRLEARRVAAEARAASRAGRLAEGVDKARKAQSLHPESVLTQAVLKECLRRYALDLLGRESKATAAQDLPRAFLAVHTAKGLNVPQRQLRERINTRYDAVTRTLAGRYMRAGVAEEAGGRNGSAWLLYVMARTVRPGFKNADIREKQARAKAAERRLYRVLVLPPETQGKRIAPGTSQAVADHVTATLNKTYGDIAAFYTPASMNGTRLKGTGMPPHAILKGRITEMWFETPAPKTQKHSARYEAGRVPELNNRVEQLQARWERAQQDAARADQPLAEADTKQKASKKALDAAQAAYDAEVRKPYNTADLRAIGQRNQRLSQLSRRANQANQTHLINMLGHQTALANQRNAQRNAERAMQDYLNEPPYVYRPVYRNYQYTKAVVSAAGIARGQYILKDNTLKATRATIPLSAQKQWSDTVVAGFAPARIKEDPLTLPASQQMVANLSAVLAKQVSDRLASPIRNHGRALLVRADTEKKRGDVLAEMHYLASAWHARKSLGADQAKLVDDRLYELTGYRCSTDKARIAKLLNIAPLPKR